MWRAELSICIVLGPRQIECGIAQDDHWQENSLICYPLAEGGDWASLKDALNMAKASLAKARETSVPRKFKKSVVCVRVLVSERWLSLANVPWSPILGQSSALFPYVSAHLSATGISLRAGDTLRLSDAHWRQQVLVAAYPLELLELLRDFAKKLGGKLESVLPTGVSAVSGICHRLASSAVVAVLEGGEVSFWRRQGRQMLLVAPMAGTVANFPELIQVWQRVLLRDPRLAGITPLHLLDIDNSLEGNPGEHTEVKSLDIHQGNAFDNRQSALRLFFMKQAVNPLDGLQRMRVTRSSVFALAVVFFAMMVTAVYQLVSLSSTLKREQQYFVDRTPPVTKQASLSLTKNDMQRVLAVNTAIQQLNLPVNSLMQAMQPPQDVRVALLGAIFAPPGGGKDSDSIVKLTAETRSGVDMARYVAYLADRPPFISAYLVNHEIVETDALKPYRFTVEAKWRE